jgi:hypothetical protein
VPSFFQDSANAFHDLQLAVLATWAGLSLTNRVFLMLALTATAIYFGAKTDRTGFSALLFLTAFGLFSYIVVIGYSVMR